MKSNIKEAILNVLMDNSDSGLVDLKSYHNQIMIAEKIENAVRKHIREEISDTIEEIVCGEPSKDCCGGDCHE